MAHAKVRRSHCPTHGPVDATRPTITPWPLVVAVPRLIAAVVRGYRCPLCGAKAAPLPHDPDQ